MLLVYFLCCPFHEASRGSQNFASLDCIFSAQSTSHFCVIDMEYSILTQNEIIADSYWRKKVTSYISTSKAAGNNESKLKKKVCLLAWNERAKWLAFQTTCLWVVFVRRSTQFWERLKRTFWRSAYVYIALPIDSRFSCWLRSFVFISLWNDNKS